MECSKCFDKINFPSFCNVNVELSLFEEFVKLKFAVEARVPNWINSNFTVPFSSLSKS